MEKIKILSALEKLAKLKYFKPAIERAAGVLKDSKGNILGAIKSEGVKIRKFPPATKTELKNVQPSHNETFKKVKKEMSEATRGYEDFSRDRGFEVPWGVSTHRKVI